MNKKINDVLKYYSFYSIGSVFFYYVINSVVTFIHFQLNHEIPIIENWIYQHSWDVIIISKFFSFFLFVSIFNVNRGIEFKLKDLIDSKILVPSKENLVLILFISIFFHSFVLQFSDIPVYMNKLSDKAYYSYIGMVSFVGIDALFLMMINQLHFLSNKYLVMLSIGLILIFGISSYIIFPNLNMAFLITAFNLLILIISIFRERLYLTNILMFCFSVIGPMAIFYGVDLVWQNTYSIFKYDQALPLSGVLAIWVISFVYYIRSTNVDDSLKS